MNEKKLKLLVVDDSVINQKLAKALLEKLEHAVDIASNGLEALDLALKNEYDIIFMDIHMPELDGIEATKKIRDNGKSMPVIAMSGDEPDNKFSDWQNAGMTDFLSKPYSIDKISDIIKKWI
ncbi:MAG: response regulator [Spirochaetia bacterium]|nr:response regulator [Spirochaetia bacterium]